MEDWPTTLEVSRTLSVTQVRVWQLLKEKKLAGKKRGRQWFIVPKSLRAYIRKKEEGSKS